MFEHLVQRLDAFLRVALNLFADFINRGSFPDAVGDVGLVNHYGAEMAVEDVCVELAGFAGAHGFQEVGNVVAAAVALELPDLLAVVVEGPAPPR